LPARVASRCATKAKVRFMREVEPKATEPN
jgi:hypothetical protein